jgi:hypothetical protein
LSRTFASFPELLAAAATGRSTHLRRARVQKDGGVKKKFLVLGSGWEQPEKDDKVFGALLGSPMQHLHELNLRVWASRLHESLGLARTSVEGALSDVDHELTVHI